MQVQKFNISKPKKYTDRDGNEKTQWNNIGTMTEFHKEDGSISRIIEIPALGLDANIFPFQEREGSPAPRKSNEDDSLPVIDASRPEDDEVDVKDIPF